jgi:hypothetical protein
MLALETAVQAALARGDDEGLRVLGHGEMSLVLGWPAARPRVAAKRLPPFADADAADAWEDLFRRYLAHLDDHRVATVPTAVRRVPLDDGRVAVYCLQPALDARTLAPRLLAEARPSPEHPIVVAVIDAIARAVTPRAGLDAQLSNWALQSDGTLAYLDLTTPLLAREDGTTELDPALFLAAYPWALRGALRRFVVPELVRRYHDPRTVLLDLCANLHKERLAAWIPAFLDAGNAILDRGVPPLSAEEVARDYARDARLWSLMLSLRRADRWWQRTIRRRPYPFLLPRATAR